MLQGTEVKSLREGGANLDHAYARIERGEMWLIDCHIGPYRHAAPTAHESIRKRKLLLHSREIRKIEPKLKIKGLTIVPLEIRFNSRGLAKVIIALARGKSHRDKRQDLKAREDRRDMERVTKSRRL